MINETLNLENGVNGTRPSGQGASPGTVSGELQPEPGRNPATARRGWGNRLNKTVMECCLRRMTPVKRGYRKRMLAFCEQLGEFEVTEQRLADQARQIRVNGWLSDFELEEINRKTQDPISAQERENAVPEHQRCEGTVTHESFNQETEEHLYDSQDDPYCVDQGA